MPHVLAQDLRDAVLQAAVQGKLTRQLNSDEPVSKLKEKLFYDNKLQLPDDLPTEIPESWEWIPIGCLGKSLGTESFSDGPFGSNLKREHQILEPEVRIIQLSNIGDNGWRDDNVKYTSHKHLDNVIPRCEVRPGDFVIAKMMPAGRTICVPELGTRITLGSDAMKFVPNPVLNSKYLLHAMHSRIFLDQVYSGAHGITRIRTTLKGIKSYVIPLPPIEEQARIVARVDELMAKIDEYEKLEKELVDLQSKFPGDMYDAILQAAMQGLLTEHLKNDSPVDHTLSKSKKCSKLEEGLEIPEHWINVHLEDIAHSISTKPYQILDSEIRKDGKYPVISQSKQYSIGFSDREDKVLNHNVKLVAFGDHTTVVKLIDFPFIVGADGVKLFESTLDIIPEYLFYCIKFNADQVTNKGGYSRHFKFIKNKPIPLPPIEEQQRIVEKLNQLLPLVERLDKMND